jgi:hypothetical protein
MDMGAHLYLLTPAIHNDDEWIRLVGTGKRHHHNNKTFHNLLTYHRTLPGLSKRMQNMS